MEVQSKHFQAALQRVPPSLTRGVQMLSETGKILVLCIHHNICLFLSPLAGEVHDFAAIEVMHLPE